MERVQELLGPEGVIAALVMVVAIGAREWRRVQLARERRREREQELLAKMVSGVAEGGREVQVHHGGPVGAWSLTGTASAAGREAPVDVDAPVRGRRGSAGRRR
ncbi:hypothetical protein [Streptomyces lancefieldiae]|uniref:Secreted protein n=1 Tax=Streptomyces lancefieldiae TaxID=3075520 RepID=A0ABU3B114_9ACTN|nr:hypothetical protein [Streptomyces sp. DSM 40712]MDT0616136.1 hypothetical protein [Streptomyces sp. DSM 40712]